MKLEPYFDQVRRLMIETGIRAFNTALNKIPPVDWEIKPEVVVDHVTGDKIVINRESGWQKITVQSESEYVLPDEQMRFLIVSVVTLFRIEDPTASHSECTNFFTGASQLEAECDKLRGAEVDEKGVTARIPVALAKQKLDRRAKPACFAVDGNVTVSFVAAQAA